MKNIVIYFFIFLLFSTSCIEKTPKVGFLLPNLIHNRYKKEKDLFTERVKELGGETMFAEANNDPFKQIKQAKTMIDSGAKVLVISGANINIAGEIVRLAHHSNVKVISYDRLILNSDLDFYITFKYEAIGRLMIESAIKEFPKGNYAIFGGDRSDYNALEISKGQINAIKPHIDNGNIKLIYNISIEEWSDETCAIETRNLINMSKIIPDAIIASSDKLALGVINVLKSNKLEGKIYVTGMDADILGCKRILEGSQAMSVYKPFKPLAIIAAETAMILIKTGKLPNTENTHFNGFKEVPVIYLDPIVVTKENMKEIISNSGIITMEEVLN